MFNKLKTAFAALAIAASASSACSAQQGLSDPMTKAMMDVYQQELDANPRSRSAKLRVCEKI